MIYLVYSKETASSNIANAMKGILNLEESTFNGFRCFDSKDVKLIEFDGRLIDAEPIDKIVDGIMIFLSRHSSSKGIPAFTVHAEGNWSDDCPIGGKPKSLSVSSPLSMLNFLNSMNAINDTGIELTYEATHHGPLTENPSLFVELGGSEGVIKSEKHAKILATAVADSLHKKPAYEKVAVGIGGLHYSAKFTKLALNGKYAFSHIMSKHYISNLDMLKYAFERSDVRAEFALIEWKSIKAMDREAIVRELNVLGIDYAKV